MDSELIIVLHALTCLRHRNTKVSSKELARSICTNPARIRKAMAKLKKVGLLETREGNSGGYELHGDTATIRSPDLAQALQQPLTKPDWRSGTLNTYCMIAMGVGTVVDTLEASLNEVCMRSLLQIATEDISQQLIAIENHKNKEEWSMVLVIANNENSYELIEKKGIAVEFWAPWCGYCRRLSPVLRRTTGEYPDLTLVQVNIDDYEKLSDRYGAETIPYMMVFHDEKPSTPLIALQAKAQVITRMKEQKVVGVEWEVRYSHEQADI